MHTLTVAHLYPSFLRLRHILMEAAGDGFIVLLELFVALWIGVGDSQMFDTKMCLNGFNHLFTYCILLSDSMCNNTLYEIIRWSKKLFAICDDLVDEVGTASVRFKYLFVMNLTYQSPSDPHEIGPKLSIAI